jgi:hypothetical protein
MRSFSSVRYLILEVAHRNINIANVNPLFMWMEGSHSGSALLIIGVNERNEWEWEFSRTTVQEEQGYCLPSRSS